MHTIISVVQGIVQLGAGLGFACAPVIGGYLYLVSSRQSNEDNDDITSLTKLYWK